MATRSPALLPLLTKATATDRDLLHRFAHGGDEAAFTALVRRHAAMVTGVCRRVLGDPAAADDACQATFLVLAKKAGSGRWRPSVASWLYATARQVALNARMARARRARHEAKATAKPAVNPLAEISGEELLAILDEELGNLPERYRAPVVLCCIEGLTRDEAAHQLAVPVATLKGQLERGRKRLHDALVRRGVTLGAGLLALLATAPAGASTRLANAVLATVRNSSPAIVANGFVQKAAFVVVAAVGVIGFGFGPGSFTPTAAGPQSTGTPTESRPEEAVTYSGLVVGPDGRTIAGATVRIIPRHGKSERFEPVTGSTDEDGRYLIRVPKDRLTDPRSGDEIATLALATAAGYFPGWTGSGTDGRIVLARADTKVAGRLTDLEGRPVAGATITIQTVYAPTGKSFEPWVDTLRTDRQSLSRTHLGPALDAAALPDVARVCKTDAAGRFEIPGYVRDRVLHAKVEGATIATMRIGLVTRDLGKSGLPGSSGITYHGTSADIVIGPSRLITGVVRDRTTGKPVAGATVQSLTMAGRSYIESGLVFTTTGADGSFRLAGMPKGTGNRFLVVPGRGQPHLLTSLDVPDPNGLEPVSVEISLDRGILIEGIVRDTAGRPVPNADVAYLVDRFNDQVVGKDSGSRSAYSALTDAAGKFQVVGLPGPGYLVAAGPGRDYLAATERKGWGASEVLQLDTVSAPTRADRLHAAHEINIPRTATEYRLNMTLELGAGATATLVGPDGKPVVGCRCLGRRAGEDWQSEVRPGEHRIDAINPKNSRPVVFRHADRNLVAVWTPAAGSHRVALQPGVTLTGRVLTEDGRPKAGVSVSVLIRPIKADPDTTLRYRDLEEKIVTDANGRFQMPALAPGFIYEVAINGQFVEGSKFDLPAKATGTRDLGDLRLRLTTD
jgi:RNA polymerase sigma factor (sigma-70 family)